jgi:hypothetical protein
MANPIRGAQLWEEIAVVLDDIIITTQQAIDINNKDIWNPYLHKWTNEDWEDMLSMIEHAMRTNPDIAKDFHKTSILNARAALDKNISRALDKKETKKYAWAAIMSMREMYNNLNGWTIKNAAGQSWPKPTSHDTYQELFTNAA